MKIEATKCATCGKEFFPTPLWPLKYKDKLFCKLTCMLADANADEKKPAPKSGKRRVLAFTLDGTLIGKYDSNRAAAEALGVCASEISKVANGKVSSAKGYIFKYEDVEKYEEIKEKGNMKRSEADFIVNDTRENVEPDFDALKLKQVPVAGEKRPNVLEKTIPLMQSGDYRERFKAEYYQTHERYLRLKAFNTKIEAVRMIASESEPVPAHDCPDELLIRQQSIMGEYLYILELRAVIEKIDL